MSNIDYDALLQQVLNHPTYQNYQLISDNPPKYRDYSKNDNPKHQLTRFGLYDYSQGKLIKNLRELAKELELPFPKLTKPASHDDLKQKKAKEKQMVKSEISNTPEMQKKLDKICERLADKDRWESRHWPLIKKYFENQRGISSGFCDAEFYRDLGVIAQKYTPKKSKESVYEIVVPVWGDPKKKTLLQLHKIQINPKTGEKLGKKIQGKLEGSVVARGIWLAAEKKLKKDRRVMVIEGLEDALSLRAAIKWRDRQQGKDGRIVWDMLVTCGTGYFAHAGKWLENYCPSSKYDKRVMILDNDGPIAEGGASGASAKASVVFEDSVNRYMPREEKQDANKILVNQGISAVWEWLQEVQENEISLEWIEDQINKIVNAEDEDCLENLHKYHFAHNPLTDTAVASVFLHRFSRIVRVTIDGQWFVYNAKKGVWDGAGGSGIVKNYIGSLYAAYKREFDKRKNAELLSDGQIRSWMEFLVSMGNNYRHSSVQKILANAEAIRCEREEFDARPDLLNCKNGVLELGTGKLLPHTPELMQSQQIAVEWPENEDSKEAKCPVFDRFIWQIVCQDQEMLAYKLRQLGYCLSGHTKAKAFFFHLGSGDNGKSIEADMMLRLMGSYARTVSPSLFTESHGGYSNEEMYELAHLPGVRLAVCGETTDRRGWSEGSLKRYTGGTDIITARPIRQASFTFKPVFKLIIHGNTKPKMATGDQAIWRRLHLIPYDFVAVEPDTELDNKLAGELPGILRRLQQGYVEWAAIGLNPPSRCIEAAEEYRNEVFNDLQEFLEYSCFTDSRRDLGFETPMRELYKEYEQFCSNHRRRPRSITALGRWLNDQGIDKRKTNGVIVRVGIRIKSEDEKTAMDFDELSPNHEEDEDLM